MLEVVVATYNGSRFLQEFLASVDRQTRRPDSILFRDDGSSDNTVEIVERYCRSRPQARLLRDPDGNVGVIGNFARLLNASTAQHVMLADQDDVWQSQKIERSWQRIVTLEQAGSNTVPALAFCDLEVVDERLRPIHRSFVDHQRLRPLTRGGHAALLTQNVAPGCAMVVNRALIDLALPIPNEACMHDWWLMQVAALAGRIAYIDEPLICYRQHGGNAIGAPSSSALGLLMRARSAARGYSCRLSAAQGQAGELLRRYEAVMDPQQRLTTRTFAELSRHASLPRRWHAWRSGLRKTGPLRNLIFYLLM